MKKIFFLFRKKRLGVDYVQDEVEKLLEIEKNKIADAVTVLNKTLEQGKEYKRDLRASLYLLNKDVKDKITCLAIDFECLNLKEYDESICIQQENEYSNSPSP